MRLTMRLGLVRLAGRRASHDVQAHSGVGLLTSIGFDTVLAQDTTI